MLDKEGGKGQLKYGGKPYIGTQSATFHNNDKPLSKQMKKGQNHVQKVTRLKRQARRGHVAQTKRTV